jgi:hypothetical protein
MDEFLTPVEGEMGVRRSIVPRRRGRRITMHVKGFILEDDQGRELVLECEQPYTRIGQRFYLRGWKRRRSVPLPDTELELPKIVGGILVTLHELFETLPRFPGHREDDISSGGTFTD